MLLLANHAFCQSREIFATFANREAKHTQQCCMLFIHEMLRDVNLNSFNLRSNHGSTRKKRSVSKKSSWYSAEADSDMV